MKIKLSELKQIIKEEVDKFKKKVELQKQLSEIEKQLEEVYAGEPMNAEKQDGVHAGQRKAEFKKKGTSLIEDKDGEVAASTETSEHDIKMEVDETKLDEIVSKIEEIKAKEKESDKKDGDEEVVSIEADTTAEPIGVVFPIKEGEQVNTPNQLNEELDRMKLLAGM